MNYYDIFVPLPRLATSGGVGALAIRPAITSSSPSVGRSVLMTTRAAVYVRFDSDGCFARVK